MEQEILTATRRMFGFFSRGDYRYMMMKLSSLVSRMNGSESNIYLHSEHVFVGVCSYGHQHQCKVTLTPDDYPSFVYFPVTDY